MVNGHPAAGCKKQRFHQVNDDRMDTLRERLRILLNSIKKNTSVGQEADAVRSASGAAALLDQTSLARLLRQVEQTNEGEYSCQETLDLLDEYAELVISNEDAGTLMPLVRSHLEHCLECGERYRALIQILQTS